MLPYTLDAFAGAAEVMFDLYAAIVCLAVAAFIYWLDTQS